MTTYLARVSDPELLAHTPLAPCPALRESNITDHPGQIKHDIQDHEDIMNIVVVAGCYVNPASASESPQNADRGQEGGKGRRRECVAIEQITGGNESKART